MTIKIKELVGKSVKDLDTFTFEEIGFMYDDGKRIKQVHVCTYIIDVDERTGEYTPIRLYVDDAGKIEGAFKPSVLLSKDIDALKDAIVTFNTAISRQAGDDRNYGLLFHQCGYDGKLQSEIAESERKKGVYIF
ncbi:MAG TPA: hypothetical protein IAA34_05335 [Candidatus Enterococcus stercoripullorum]|nr:hypothetical protein [Candidatus Enterococcus stercoripullorum]